MFLKLLKHEWRMNRGLIGMMCAIVGISGLMVGGALRYITWSSVTGNQVMVSAYSVVLATAVIALLGCCLLAMYFLTYRFYISRFTDQGYLMLTLPVTTHQQLWASIAYTATGVLLVGATAMVSVALGISIYMSMFSQSYAADLWRIFADAQSNLAGTLGLSGNLVAFQIIEIPVIFLADVILLMLALTVGAQAYKHPVLEGTVVYIGTDILISELCELIGRLTENPTLTAVISCVIYGLVAVAAYSIMHYMIDKKLNLT